MADVDIETLGTPIQAALNAIGATSAWINHAYVSQAEAEAGTEGAARSWSPLRDLQAIRALESGRISAQAGNTLSAGWEVWVGSSAAYAALTPDANTLYVVQD